MPIPVNHFANGVGSLLKNYVLLPNVKDDRTALFRNAANFANQNSEVRIRCQNECPADRNSIGHSKLAISKQEDSQGQNRKRLGRRYSPNFEKMPYPLVIYYDPIISVCWGALDDYPTFFNSGLFNDDNSGSNNFSFSKSYGTTNRTSLSF